MKKLAVDQWAFENEWALEWLSINHLNEKFIMVEWKQTVRGDFFRKQTVTTAW